MSRCEGLATANGRSAASGRQSTRNKRCHRKPERKLPRSWRHADGGDGENGDLILSIPDTLEGIDRTTAAYFLAAMKIQWVKATQRFLRGNALRSDGGG